MGCYLEEYRARVGTWAGKLAWRGEVIKRGQAKCGDDIGAASKCLGLTLLSSLTIAVLLIIGGIEQNPGPSGEMDTTARDVCTGCGRHLKTGIQCEMCGKIYHYNCGNGKVQRAVKVNWCCEECMREKVVVLQEQLKEALNQVNDLKDKIRELEDKLKMTGPVEKGSIPAEKKSIPAENKEAKCLVVGDSLVRNVGLGHSDMKVECFPGIKTVQLHKVLEKREPAGAETETAIIHVGTNDLSEMRNLDYIMGGAYVLVATAKKKLPNCKLVLSGVLRRRDIPWRRIGGLNDRLARVADTEGLTFVDPNSWIEDGDFGRDGVHLNVRGKRHLGKLYARVSGLGSGGTAEGKQ